MSFKTLGCSRCFYGVPLAPGFYRIDKQNRVMVTRYPTGEAEFSKAYKKNPHESFYTCEGLLDKQEGLIFNMICDKCGMLERRPSAASFKCSSCDEGMFFSAKKLIGCECPVCYDGVLVEIEPDPGIMV